MLLTELYDLLDHLSQYDTYEEAIKNAPTDGRTYHHRITKKKLKDLIQKIEIQKENGNFRNIDIPKLLGIVDRRIKSGFVKVKMLRSGWEIYR